jgi:glycosyltransferase 2 family protein
VVTAGGRRPAPSWLPTVVGTVLVVLALSFCIRVLVGEWDRVSDVLATASWWWLAAALLSAAVAMLVIAVRWRACLLAVGVDPPGKATVVRWYFVGELGKYLPGGIWPVVGRAELARRGGIGRSAAYGSVALSLAALYGAAVLPVALVVLHPRVVGTLRSWVARLSRRELSLDIPDIRTVARLLVSYLPAWVAVAGCTLAVARALDVGGSPWRIAAATVLAWLAGFAVVPVPAGAGVREVVFVAVAGLPAGLGVAVAVVSRLCFLLVDGLSGVVASLAPGERADGRTSDAAPERMR